ncbi:MFS transporter [Micromonospora sp. CPCC 205556]|uniref:MFS transporter n=1 Tax=Micromonospora sp. CPCC 205556 TaxID=3122398 RepID=UPI002FF1A3E5
MSLAVQFFANGFVYATLVARLPAIRDRVGISVGLLGLVLTIGSLSALLSSFFTGPVIRRFGSRRVVVGGGLLYVAALPCIGFSTTPVMLIAALVGLMFFDVFIDTAMNLQGSVVSARRHHPVMSRLHGLWSLGTVLGALVAAQLAGFAVPVPLHYTAVAAALAGALLVVMPGLLPVDEPHPRQARRERRSGRWRVPRSALALGLASALAVTVDVATGEWAAFRLSDDLGASAGVAAAAFAAYTVGMTAGRFGGDAAAARMGGAVLVRIGAAVAACGLATAALIPDRHAALVGFLLVGLGTSVFSPQLADAAARAPGPPGSGFTVLFVGHRTAALLVPALIGTAANTSTLNVGAAMALVGLPAVIGLMLVAGTTIRGRTA